MQCKERDLLVLPKREASSLKISLISFILKFWGNTFYGVFAKTKAGHTPFLVRYLSGTTHFRVGPHFKLRQASFLQCRGGSEGRLPASDWKLDGQVNVRRQKFGSADFLRS